MSFPSKMFTWPLREQGPVSRSISALVRTTITARTLHHVDVYVLSVIKIGEWMFDEMKRIFLPDSAVRYYSGRARTRRSTYMFQVERSLHKGTKRSGVSYHSRAWLFGYSGWTEGNFAQV
ncbi:hypothetical protein HA402_002562 [Bradysia odoriphaga]|nr:hypothetical protein HA402_002562 [Bradysia odoriphaga]